MMQHAWYTSSLTISRFSNLVSSDPMETNAVRVRQELAKQANDPKEASRARPRGCARKTEHSSASRVLCLENGTLLNEQSPVLCESKNLQSSSDPSDPRQARVRDSLNLRRRDPADACYARPADTRYCTFTSATQRMRAMHDPRIRANFAMVSVLGQCSMLRLPSSSTRSARTEEEPKHSHL